MSQVFHEYLDRWLVEYNIDMLVYSTIRVEHGRHLVSVLEVLSKRDSSPSSWEVSFGWGSVILGLCDDKNGHVVNTIEREHTIAPVLKLPVEIIGYVACTSTSR
jgi:hypothetical protein